MSEEILDLTSSLFRFVEASEKLQHSLRELSTPKLKAELRERAGALRTRFGRARQRAGERVARRMDDIITRLGEVNEELGERTPRLKRFRARWKALGVSYEELVAELRDREFRGVAGLSFTHLKPRNIARNVFHVGMGFTGVALYEWVLTRAEALWCLAGFLVFFILLEVFRRVSATFNEKLVKRIFAKISRPHESHQVPAATWYALAIFLGVAFMDKHPIELGILVLAVGDPVASFTGKTWGKNKIWRQKSLAGALGFQASATVIGMLFLVNVVGLAWLPALGIASAAAFVGAVTELLSDRLDDNFTIPLAVGGFAMLLL